MPVHNPEPSECSCALQPGEWGSCGYHYYRMTEQRFVRREMQRFFGSLKGALRHTQADEDRARADAVNLSQHYIGEPTAFEQCPKYREAMEREIAKEKIRTGSPSKGKRTYADGEGY